MKRAFLVVLILAAGFAGGYGWGRWYGPKTETAQKQEGGRKVLYWYDPMHPSYRSDKPGIAPDCGMDLVPMYEGGAAEAKPQARILYYRDPKQPSYTSDKPGLNPETGNDLEPVYEAAAPGTVTIPAEKQQWIGIRTEQAAVTGGHYSMRAAGRVAVDETRIVRVQSRTDGWIEKVNVDFTGRLVCQGETMLTIYSPELVASQQEYLLARKAQSDLESSPVPGVRQYNATLLSAARSRLERHWLMDAKAVEQLEKSGTPVRSMPIVAPASGFVLTRNAFPNQRVTPETELYALADLSRVWIIADVFEADAAKMRLGMMGTVEPAYAPGQRFRARVTYIYPQIEAQTRTLKVRLEADNPGFALKPDLFVHVDFTVAAPPRLSVPEDAVLDSGLRRIVWVDKGEGHFEPRAVETGEAFDGRVEILAGLREGERIVTNGAFMLDSESKMKNPTSAPSGATAKPAPAAPPPAEHKHD
jgi:RND family efflux transporter MFP subunit